MFCFILALIYEPGRGMEVIKHEGEVADKDMEIMKDAEGGDGANNVQC